MGTRSSAIGPKPIFHFLVLSDHWILAVEFITALEQEVAFAQLIAIFYPLPKGDVNLNNFNVSTMSVFLKTKLILLSATCVAQLLLTQGYRLCKVCGSHPELQVTLGRRRWRGLYLGKLRGKSSPLNITPANVLLRGWAVRGLASLEKMD